MTGWTVDGDHGYSTGKENAFGGLMKKLLKMNKGNKQFVDEYIASRQKTAAEKIEAWRKKNAFKKASMLKQRGKNGR